jgi:cysteine-rich repeat protein
MQPTSTQCRAAAGTCDLAENCDGVGNACPADAVRPSTDECRAATGSCDVSETCDGAGTDCPADAFKASTEVCRADAGACDVPEICSGIDATCPADGFEPDGTTCNDGTMCTLNDVCTAGQCDGDSVLCGDGTQQPNCNETCDDGNTVSGDGCSDTCQREFVCPPAPATGCLLPFQPAKAKVTIINKAPNTTKDKIVWKWVKGERTTVADFGTPLTTTQYLLCIYDNDELRTTALVPAGGICSGKPCWTAKVTGFKYKNKLLGPDGIQQIVLKAGEDGKAKIVVKGRGDLLQMPSPMPVAMPIRVQLSQSDGVCWEANYSAPAIQNRSDLFKDKAD